MFSPILLIHGQKLMLLLLLIAERVLVTDSAFTVSPRQVRRSSRRPHLDLAKLALDRLLEELSPAGGGHLARPPLRSALHGHRMWCRNSCSLRLLPLLPVQDQAAATSSPSHVHLPQLALAQLPAHAPARARPRPPRPTAPLATSRVTHRTHARPAHLITDAHRLPPRWRAPPCVIVSLFGHTVPPPHAASGAMNAGVPPPPIRLSSAMQLLVRHTQFGGRGRVV
jgi:hypothetical protein